jgi:hypothetical protein
MDAVVLRRKARSGRHCCASSSWFSETIAKASDGSEWKRMEAVFVAN